MAIPIMWGRYQLQWIRFAAQGFSCDSFCGGGRRPQLQGQSQMKWIYMTAMAGCNTRTSSRLNNQDSHAIMSPTKLTHKEQQQQRQSGAMECHSECRVSRQTRHQHTLTGSVRVGYGLRRSLRPVWGGETTRHAPVSASSVPT